METKVLAVAKIDAIFSRSHVGRQHDAIRSDQGILHRKFGTELRVCQPGSEIESLRRRIERSLEQEERLVGFLDRARHVLFENTRQVRNVLDGRFLGGFVPRVEIVPDAEPDDADHRQTEQRQKLHRRREDGIGPPKCHGRAKLVTRCRKRAAMPLEAAASLRRASAAPQLCTHTC